MSNPLLIWVYTFAYLTIFQNTRKKRAYAEGRVRIYKLNGQFVNHLLNYGLINKSIMSQKSRKDVVNADRQVDFLSPK